ncbi:hypothetical protein FBZ98_103712 [Rhizobium sp. ERR 922]|nr:hypothetical protein FBZ98_103712 [Rhizobium sp. ERR 922]TWB97349.1 hypothetical protein FBZ97_103171 [Rhizobium sp. ERR 942]
MERYAVEYRPEAVENLLDVAAYVFELSQNIRTAEGYIGRIYARCEKIVMHRSEALLETT